MPLPSTAQYVEYAPAAPLRPYVACYWSRRPGAADAPAGHRVLPDGCIDILLELPGAGDDVAPRDRSSLAVVGTMTRALVVPPGPRLTFLGVRFRPGGAYPFLGVPAAELTDRQVELGDLWGEMAALADALAAAPGLTAKMRVLERVLLDRLARVAPPPREVGAAVDAILRTTGATPVETLSDTLGVTRQHLARQFARWVGVPPKTFCRVVRAQGVARAARATAAERVGWSALAHELGYYDQAHLIAEFKELSGMTPEGWLRANGR